MNRYYFRRTQLFFAIALIVSVVVASYAPALRNGLARDDAALFAATRGAGTSESFFGALLKIHNNLEIHSGYFRPVALATHVIDRYLWKDNPAGAHLTNVVLHALACIALFLVLAYVSGRIDVSAIAVVLFASHPIHFEAVGLIHNRSDILCLLFSCMAILLCVRHRSTNAPVYVWTSVAMFLLALLSKESAIVVPLVILVCEYVLQHTCADQPKNRPRYWYDIYVLTVFVWLVLRAAAIGSVVQTHRVWGYYNFPLGDTALWRVWTALKILWQYISLLGIAVLPSNFCADYFLAAANSPWSVPVVLGASVLGMLITGLVVFRKRWPLGVFGIAWFLLFYAPVANIVPIGHMFAERYMYIPSAGLFVIIGGALCTLREKIVSARLQKYGMLCMIILIGAVVGILISASFIRNYRIRDDRALWAYSARHPLSTPRAHLMVAQYAIRDGMFLQAERALERALIKNKRYIPARLFLGYVYKKTGRFGLAERAFISAARIAREENDTRSLHDALDELHAIGIRPSLENIH